jgi:hypothetical protein
MEVKVKHEGATPFGNDRLQRQSGLGIHWDWVVESEGGCFTEYRLTTTSMLELVVQMARRAKAGDEIKLRRL